MYARLTENQLINRHEPEKGMFIAESPKIIERALDAGYMPVSILTEKRHIEGEGQKILARCGEIPVYTAEFDVPRKADGVSTDQRNALCDVPAAAPFGAECLARGQNELQFWKMW